MIIPRGTEGGCLKTSNSAQCSNPQIHETIQEATFGRTNSPLAFAGVGIVALFATMALLGWIIWGNGRQWFASVGRRIAGCWSTCYSTREKTSHPTARNADAGSQTSQKFTPKTLEGGRSDRMSLRSGAYSVTSLGIIKEVDEGDRKQAIPTTTSTVNCEMVSNSPELDTPKERS